MAKFRKKPIVIEAEQFFPAKRHWPKCIHPWPDKKGLQPRDLSYGYIETLEGRMHVMAGDWIITGVNGEKYPCKRFDSFCDSLSLENNHRHCIDANLGEWFARPRR